MNSKDMRAVEIASRTTDSNVSKTDVKMYEEERKARQRHEFFLPNEKNLAVLQALKDVNPAYAKHMTTRNDLINAFAFVMGGGVDILTQPICGHCEVPATWGTFDQVTGENACTCSVCGRVTQNPITVEQYLAEYVKGVDKITLEAIRPRLNEVIHLIDTGQLGKKKEVITT